MLGLADPVGAVDGLGFDGGVPPGIEENHVAGGGEVEAGTTRFEGDEENSLAFMGLKAFDESAPVFGGTGEKIEGPTALRNFGADEVQHLHKLGEDEDFITLFHEGFEKIQQGVQFSAFLAFDGAADELGVTADLAQAEQAGEDVESHAIKGGGGIGFQ